MNGVIVVDKPAGPTSHDVVARVRRTIGVRRIGHTGTLDPLATGVLPLVVGRATRLAQFLSADEKEYVADVRFGVATTSYDGEGPHRERARCGIDTRRRTSRAQRAARRFPRHLLADTSPILSEEGRRYRAYRLARAEKPVELKPVKVTVRDLELLSCGDGLAKLRIVCSSGFYVRSLAHEIGTRLGCGAYLQALRRTRAGEFTIAEATTLEGIESAGVDAMAHLVPMTRLAAATASGRCQRTRGATCGARQCPGTRRSLGTVRPRMPSECGSSTRLERCWESPNPRPAVFCTLLLF